MLSRRQFIAQGGSLISTASFVPTMLCRGAQAAMASRDEPVLVVIQLDGGNDGLNTVVPYDDDAYARARPKLHIAAKDVHKLSDSIGLHPRMRAAKELFDDGLLTIVQGVGYPNPDRSHFRSMRIWQTASFDEAAHHGYGWLGRALDRNAPKHDVAESAAFFVGEEQVPVAVWGRRSEAVACTHMNDLALARKVPLAGAPAGNEHITSTKDPSLAQFVTRQMLSAYWAADQAARRRPADGVAPSYPDTPLAARLGLIARLLKSGSAARVFYTLQSGYDTHAAQAYKHGQLLAEFSQALRAFLTDVQAAGLSERVLVLAFSEFGRRVAENDSLGTDHGAAGPVILAGSRVKGGLIGPAPNVSRLEEGDLAMTTDFRAVYATILEGWLGVSSSEILSGSFERLALLAT